MTLKKAFEHYYEILYTKAHCIDPVSGQPADLQF